jgi:hypothetical protein
MSLGSAGLNPAKKAVLPQVLAHMDGTPCNCEHLLISWPSEDWVPGSERAGLSWDNLWK